jgi:hypothetical protein
MATETKASVGMHENVRVLQVPLILVEYTRNGRTETKLAVIIGHESVGHDVHFFQTPTSAAPEDLKRNILIAAGMKEPNGG